IRAALILRLARTRRRAMVGSATRKDRATSLVDRPPSRRRVSATCASVESAGWQQVKMRRSRSSCTGPSSSGMPGSPWGGESAATSPSSSRPRDSRRRRSMARLRAVVVIQPPGLGGRPSPGHLRRATANASCTASSATSMSLKTRISAATDRPDSSRKIRPTSPSSSLGAASPSRTPSGLRGRKRTDLDRPPDGGGVGLVQAGAEDPGAGRLQLLVEGLDPLPGLLHLLVRDRLADLALNAVDGQQVLRHGGPPRDGGRFPPLTPTTNGPPPD